MAYVLATISLIALISYGLAKQSGSNAQLQAAFETKQTLIRQVQLIRSRILSCGIAYPTGNNGNGYVNRVRYPATPVSGKVRDLSCPGLPPGSDNLWTGMGGATVPLPPVAFSEWEYVSDATSMRLRIVPASSADAASLRVLNAVELRIGETAAIVNDGLEITLMH